MLMLPRDVLRGVHQNQKALVFPRSLFLTKPMKMYVFVKPSQSSDGFLTSAPEDFGVCFENDRRATRRKET